MFYGWWHDWLQKCQSGRALNPLLWLRFAVAVRAMVTYLGSKRHLLNLQKAREKLAESRFDCQFCQDSFGKSNITKHENFCYLNPLNLRLCIVCETPIKSKRTKTCSYGCSNTYFRSGPNHGLWSEEAYRTTCFYHHKKECVVCREKNIVEVHHFDGDHENNSPKNLIPLCPTHHRYWHSRFRRFIENIIKEYISTWKDRKRKRRRVRLK